MLDIEIVTPEQAQTWIDAGIHARYDNGGMTPSFTKDGCLDMFKLELGQRLLVVLGTDNGEVLDGALALHAVVRFGKPVECAVMRVPDLHSYRMKEWEALPRGWAFLKMAPEHRPQFARKLGEELTSQKAKPEIRIPCRNEKAKAEIVAWFEALMEEHGIDAYEGIAGVFEENAELWRETGSVYPEGAG